MTFSDVNRPRTGESAENVGLAAAQRKRLYEACVSTFIAGICLTVVMSFSRNLTVNFVISLVGFVCLALALYLLVRSASEPKGFVINVWLSTAVGILPVLFSEFLR